MIQGTFFKDAVERFESIMKEGRVYLLSNGNVKSANKKFTNINNEFSITFDRHAIVKDITTEEDPSLALDDP